MGALRTSSAGADVGSGGRGLTQEPFSDDSRARRVSSNVESVAREWSRGKRRKRRSRRFGQDACSRAVPLLSLQALQFGMGERTGHAEEDGRALELLLS